MTKTNRFSLKYANTRKTLLIMKLITLFLIAGMSVTYANSYSQNTMLSLKMKNTTIQNVFQQIESNSEYIFLYQDETLDSNKKVSIDVNNKTIDEILGELFAGTNNTYKVADRQVLISFTKEISGAQAVKQQEKITIRGNVTDIDSNPLVGASVILKDNPGVGTITDMDGNYTISVPNRYTKITFRYIGFVDLTEEVGSRQVINIVLHEDVGQLEEIVVVGFGSQKKASVVGSISTIEPGQLQAGTSRSLSNNLVGNVGGIIGAQRSGEPGYDDSEFWIRGISTFAKGGARNPLVLVDGIERSLNNIDSQEIESFSVLKDASATAVYGVRGANGVVLITTKRGQVGKPTVRFNVEHGITEPVKMPKFLGAADYMDLINDIAIQEDKKLLFDSERIRLTRLGLDPELYPDVDWSKAVFKDQGSNTKASVDVSGGTERLRYSFVGAFYHEDGIIDRDKGQSWDSSLRLDRFNLRSNVDLNITNTTLMRVSIGGYLQKRTGGVVGLGDLAKMSFDMPPMMHPTQYSTGEIPKIPERTNPWAEATQRGYARDSRSSLETLLSVEQDLKSLLPGLKAKVTFSFDNFSRNGVLRGKQPDYYNPATGRDPETGALALTISNYGQEFLGYEKQQYWGNNSVYLEGNISYDHTFAEKHNVGALFLYNQKDYDKGDELPYRNQGIAGRASYTYDGKYIAEFNFGYNGSENFAKGKRFGFFPSVAAGWIMSEESFMQPYSKTFSKIKFRVSHGLVGNDQFGSRRFAYLTTITSKSKDDGYYWGYLADFHRAGKWEGEIGVPNLTWETVKKTNVGFELGLWNMVDLQVDYFKERRKDIFMQRNSIPSSAGFPIMPWANFGKVNNEGVDITLNVSKKINKDWHVSVRGTLTYAKNKIIEQDEEMGVIGTNRSTTGRSVGQIMALVDDGLFTEADFKDVATGELASHIPQHLFGAVRPGDIKYKDLNGDGVVDKKDITAIGGTQDPQLVYGFGANVVYKGFDLGFLFQGTGRTYRIIGGGNVFLPGSAQGASGNIYTNADDRWTLDNPSEDVFYPRLSIGINTNNSQQSSWWLRDMSTLRLKNLEFGYSLPKDLIRKAAMQNVRVFARGTNLLTISDFKLWDPELNTANNNGIGYPMMRSYSLGLQVNF